VHPSFFFCANYKYLPPGMEEWILTITCETRKSFMLSFNIYISAFCMGRNWLVKVWP
jgi:hypothetical protein